MDENKKALIKDNLSSIDERIPQGNHLVRVINQLIDHLKQTSIMEPPITACFNKKDGY